MHLFNGKNVILRPKKFTRLRRAALFLSSCQRGGVLLWSDPSFSQSVVDKCTALKLKAIADNLQQTIILAEHKNWSSLQAIDHLFTLELELRRKNRIDRCFKQSKLYETPTIDQFDFNYHHSRKKNKNRILNLMDLEFAEHKKDIIFIGNPGVGKNLLAKCTTYAATQAGQKVLFTTAMDMINHLIAAEADHSLLK